MRKYNENAIDLPARRTSLSPSGNEKAVMQFYGVWGSVKTESVCIAWFIEINDSTSKCGRKNDE